MNVGIFRAPCIFCSLLPPGALVAHGRPCPAWSPRAPGQSRSRVLSSASLQRLLSPLGTLHFGSHTVRLRNPHSVLLGVIILIFPLMLCDVPSPVSPFTPRPPNHVQKGQVQVSSCEVQRPPALQPTTFLLESEPYLFARSGGKRVTPGSALPQFWVLATAPGCTAVPHFVCWCGTGLLPAPAALAPASAASRGAALGWPTVILGGQQLRQSWTVLPAHTSSSAPLLVGRLPWVFQSRPGHKGFRA